jgi:hypothetical protein
MYLHDPLHHGGIIDDHKMPGLLINGRRGVHGSSQKGLQGAGINLLVRESPDTSPVKYIANFFHYSFSS